MKQKWRILKDKKREKVTQNILNKTQREISKRKLNDENYSKESIKHFQQDLNYSASILIVPEETIRIMKEKHKIKINISVETLYSSGSIGLLESYYLTTFPWFGSPRY